MRYSRIQLLEYLLVVTNVIGWIITLLYYYYVYAHGENPPLCKAEMFGFEINCAKVAQSPYSKVVLGPIEIPIALIAVAWFTTKAILCIYYISCMKRLLDVILILSAIGTPLIPYLVYIEVFDIHAICTYCTFLQIFIVVTLIVAIKLKLVEKRLEIRS